VSRVIFSSDSRSPANHCLRVGIGGHVLHGGQGYSSHNHGLLLDSLIEADIVLASGEVITTSEAQSPDLFWALRGAGMSFGIVTKLKFTTFEAPSEIVLFYYPYYWNQTQARAGWDAWQAYCGGFTTPQIPAELNIRWVISMEYGLLIFLLGMCALNTLVPLKQTLPIPGLCLLHFELIRSQKEHITDVKRTS
jgi:uncharacterized protein YfiM (DUF2279 family)